MSILKNALTQIKNVSEGAFKHYYDAIKNHYLKESVFLPTYNIDNLEQELNELNITIDIKIVEGISIIYQEENKKIYALPTYGWDGGSPIHSEELNIQSIHNNDFGGGPTADIVVLKDASYPGFALYYSSENYLGEIHIFMP